jgi:hypothetical protein
MCMNPPSLGNLALVTPCLLKFVWYFAFMLWYFAFELALLTICLWSAHFTALSDGLANRGTFAVERIAIFNCAVRESSPLRIHSGILI